MKTATLLHSLLLLIGTSVRLVVAQQCFSTNQELRNAVIASFAPTIVNETELGITANQVAATYGSVGAWCFEESLSDFSGVFEDITDFNLDISDWDVTNAVSFDRLFFNATSFNQDISVWDTSNVTSLQSTFELAESFNQPINEWQVNSVKNFDAMFARTLAFDQPLSGWKLSSAVSLNSMFRHSVFNQDVGEWDVSEVKTMVSMFRGNTVFDQDVSNWNTSSVIDMDSMWDGCSSFRGVNLGKWKVNSVENMHDMFKDASGFNVNLGGWQTGNVETMEGMFDGATMFEGDGIAEWDTSSCTNFVDMFRGAAKFNQDLSSWDIRKAGDMERMFSHAESLSQDLCAWGHQVTDIPIVDGMFKGTACPSTDDPSDSTGPFCYSCDSEQSGSATLLQPTALLASMLFVISLLG